MSGARVGLVRCMYVGELEWNGGGAVWGGGRSDRGTYVGQSRRGPMGAGLWCRMVQSLAGMWVRQNWK